MKNADTPRLTHPFPPVFDEHSRVLILGSFPSVKSREVSFYYGHPQNRFWKVLAALFGSPVPADIPEKTAFVLSHGIALWDSIESCRITGSSDTSIREARPNDVAGLLRKVPIHTIFTNGSASMKVYNRYLLPQTGIPAIPLPSTSPANAAFTLEKLIAEWEKIRIAAESENLF